MVGSISTRTPPPPPSPTAEPTGPTLRVGRGRRPFADVRAAVLTAAAGTLFHDGIAAFTIDGVARRAGVSRVTVHRHWPSRGALALDAFTETFRTDLAFQDTGDLRADLHAVLGAFARLMASEPAGRAFAQLLGAAQLDPDLAEAIRERYFEPRRATALALLNGARDRGELPAGVDAAIAVDMMWGACYNRLLMPGLTGTLSEAFAHAVVDLALAGIDAFPDAPRDPASTAD